MKISCIALAGGRGSRLGRDKVLELVGAGSIVERVITCLSFFDSEIIIVRAKNQTIPAFDNPKLKIVTDIYPLKGPLGGLYTGLVKSVSLYNLVVGGDMPFLNRAFLSYMVGLATDYDIVAPRVGDMVEPLHAVYSKNSLPAVEYLLKRDDLRISKLLNMLKVRYVETDEIDRFDPEHLSFFNINTEVELERAKEIIKRTGYDKC